MNRKEKRKARMLALQLAYGNELTGSDPEFIGNEFFNHGNASEKPKEKTLEYGKKLCSLAIYNRSHIDELIVKYSKNWALSRIALTDRLALRIALTEMIYIDDVPYKVSISEAVEISKSFGSEESGAFVNGILDAAYNDFKKGKQLAE